jgi:HNH endonuclease
MSTELAILDISTKTYPNVFTVFDFDDVNLLLDGKGRWIAARFKSNTSKLYAVRAIGGRLNRQFQLMHRVILGLSDPSIQGDHKNGDTLDNRRANLRQATPSQNARNMKRRGNGTSKFKGVSLDKTRNLWIASIIRKEGYGREHLGRFIREDEAAKAYDAVAHHRYGEFARLNFPEVFYGK